MWQCVSNTCDVMVLWCCRVAGSSATYSGHAIEHKGEMYLMPCMVDPANDKFDPLVHSFPLSSLYRYCREDLDQKVREVNAPSFVFFLDCCRNGDMASAADDKTTEPKDHQGPRKMSVCYSCARSATASDGSITQGHSPFAQQLLHDTKGIFAPGIPLKQGLEQACNRQYALLQQNAVTHSLHHIPDDLCLRPLAITPRAYLAHNRAELRLSANVTDAGSGALRPCICDLDPTTNTRYIISRLRTPPPEDEDANQKGALQPPPQCLRISIPQSISGRGGAGSSIGTNFAPNIVSRRHACIEFVTCPDSSPGRWKVNKRVGGRGEGRGAGGGGQGEEDKSIQYACDHFIPMPS